MSLELVDEEVNIAGIVRRYMCRESEFWIVELWSTGVKSAVFSGIASLKEWT